VRLSLFDCPDGTVTEPGNRVVYDVAADEARFGAASVPGRALVFELHEEERAGAVLSAELELGEGTPWIVRCDRVDFPPGGVAHLHTHPGPGIRCLLFGEITIETGGRSATYGPAAAWFERGPDPVHATASAVEETAFVRVMLLPAEWEGKRTIRYVREEDAERPKLQRARVYFDVPLRR